MSLTRTVPSLNRKRSGSWWGRRSPGVLPAGGESLDLSLSCRVGPGKRSPHHGVGQSGRVAVSVHGRCRPPGPERADSQIAGPIRRLYRRAWAWAVSDSNRFSRVLRSAWRIWSRGARKVKAARLAPIARTTIATVATPARPVIQRFRRHHRHDRSAQPIGRDRIGGSQGSAAARPPALLPRRTGRAGPWPAPS